MSEKQNSGKGRQDPREIKRARYRDPAFAGEYDSRYCSGINKLNTLVEKRWIAGRVRGLVLDAGAGAGRFSVYLKQQNNLILALDSSLQMLAGLREKNSEIPVSAGDIYSLPLKDRSVESIVCMRVLFHLPDWRLVLAEFARVLCPGGHLIFEMRSGEHVALARRVLGLFGHNIVAAVADPAGVTLHETRQAVEQALRECGLEPVHHLSYDIGHAYWMRPLAGILETLLYRSERLRAMFAGIELALGQVLPPALTYRTLYCGRKQ